MRITRRAFLKRLASVASGLGGGTVLAGCLGESGSAASDSPAATAAPTVQSNTTAGAAPAMQAAPTVQAQNAGPVWQPAPTIEFVDGVPSKVSVKQFVQDANNDPLIISLQSGALIPGITWNPNTAMIEYDGRPLGAKPDAPTVVTGITFVADDGKP